MSDPMKLGSEETYNLIEKFWLFINIKLDWGTEGVYFQLILLESFIILYFYYYPTVEYIFRHNHLNYNKTIKLSLAHVACLGYDTLCTRQAIMEETNIELNLNDILLTFFWTNK